MKRRRTVAALILAGLFSLTVSTGARAAQPVIELSYASLYAPMHAYSIADIKFIERIEKATNGRVKIKPYWSGTRISGKETVRELAQGMADIAYITPIYEKSGVDITKALLGFFQGTPSPAVNAKIFWELYDKYPELRKEYQGVKLLAVNVAGPMALMSVVPVQSLTDIKGLRIKTSADMVAPLRDVGAEGLAMPMGEAYESLQKGILKAVFAPPEAYKSLKFADMIKYETVNFKVERGVYGSRAMNAATWQKLPQDIKDIFEANKHFWTEENSAEAEKTDDIGRELANKAGVKQLQMKPEDVQKFDSLYDSYVEKTAKDLDAKGLPGSKIYADVKRLLRTYSAKK